MSFGDFDRGGNDGRRRGNNAGLPTSTSAGVNIHLGGPAGLQHASTGSSSAAHHHFSSQAIPLTSSSPTPSGGTISSTFSAIDSSKIWDRASHSVFLISNNVASVQQLVGLLGGPKDTHETRARLHALTEDTKGIIKQASTDLKSLNVSHDHLSDFEAKQRRIGYKKLQKDFEDVLRRFQAVSKLAAERSREHAERVRHSHRVSIDEDEDADEDAPLMGSGQHQQHHHQQQQQQLLARQSLDNEIDYNEGLITEREEDIENIQRSIAEVNEIFRDLSLMVNQQQADLDNIEGNVESTLNNAQEAHGELTTAAKYLRMSANKMCCFWIILAVVVAVVLLIVLAK
ncbi:SNAP receptor [Irineochytrium annulatum]|nr:SNAP receptor [Irineochytrium annulatum]